MQSEIPRIWKKGTIADIAFINPRTKLSNLSDNSLVTFLSMSDIGENGRILSKEIRKYKDVKQGFTCFAENDIIFAKITPCMENGKGAFAADLHNGIGFGSTEFHILRARESGNPKFIYHITRSKRLRLKAEGYMRGSAGQQRVPKGFFYDYSILIPPLAEQHLIAGILDIFDKNIEKTEALIEKHKMIRQGLMQDLFSKGVDEKNNIRNKKLYEFRNSPLGEIPAEWEVMTIGSSTDFITDYRGKTPPYSNSGIPVISAENVGDGRIKSITKYVTPEVYRRWTTRGVPEAGDVILTTEAPVGEVASLPDDRTYLLTRRVIALHPKGRLLRKRFLYWYLLRLRYVGTWDALTHGSTVPRILKPDILDLPICKPKLEEQEKIIAILDSQNANIEAEETYRDKLKLLKTGLMQDLLKGKVRVKVEECQENTHV